MPIIGTKSAASPSSSPENVTGTSRISINLFDVDRLDPDLRRRLLSRRLALKPIRLDGGEIDGDTLLAFSCDDLSAALICDLLRSEDRKEGHRPTRVYIRRGGAWVKIQADAVLTLRLRGEMALNPKLF